MSYAYIVRSSLPPLKWHDEDAEVQRWQAILERGAQPIAMT